MTNAAMSTGRRWSGSANRNANHSVFRPAFQTGTTARIVSCRTTGVTDNEDEYLATRAMREGLRRGIRQKVVGSQESHADKANRSGRN